jgi:hypothetical protein
MSDILYHYLRLFMQLSCRRVSPGIYTEKFYPPRYLVATCTEYGR